MPVALFDLDETLIAGDSDYLWGQYLVAKGAVDGDSYERTNRMYYEQYQQGTLDIFEFSRFAFKPLSELPLEDLLQWREEFVQQKIEPIMLDKGRELVEHHRRAGHKLVIITSTNSFITEPIAAKYDVHQLLASEPEMIDGNYTGGLYKPCFSRHKVDRLNEWLQLTGNNLSGSYAYSDSHNDIPLLENVVNSIAVDPDEKLEAHALLNDWTIISLRD